MMDGPRDELLAGAGLTCDENGYVYARRFTEDLTSLHHSGAAAEVHLVSDPSVDLLGRGTERFGRRTDGHIDGLLQFVEAHRFVQHRFHPQHGGAGAVAVAIGYRDDGPGVQT